MVMLQPRKQILLAVLKFQEAAKYDEMDFGDEMEPYDALNFGVGGD